MDAVAAGLGAVPDVATPVGSGGLLARLLSGPTLPAFAARAGAMIASALGRPVRFGTNVIAARHVDVMELLARDLDFRIGPVNAARIEAVNGPFVLGMDRGCTLAREREALYRALAEVDLAPIRATVEAEARQRIADAGDGTIDAVNGYARPIAAGTARALFGVGGTDPALFMDVARAIFAHTFLNLAGDKQVEARALRAAALMREWLAAEIARRRASGAFGSDMMGALMRDGTLDDDGVRRTLGGMLVGSIDTTASAVAKIVAMIGRDSTLAARITADAGDEARLGGWCREVLRRWPHNPILLRQAAAETMFGGVAVQPGDKVIAWTQAAMLDASVFPDPGQLRPDRPTGIYLHFGGGLHPCAGRVVNAFQIPALVGVLARQGIGKVGPLAWAGPFPNHLPVHLKRTAS